MSFLKTLLTLSLWFRSRKYKSGTTWCFWRWSDVESEYILRLHIVKTPWFAVCLHWIRKADVEPWLHDHPVSFLSVILRGSYAEVRVQHFGPKTLKVHRWFNYISASRADRHRIVFTRANTLTLCFMGPKTREWGFHIPGKDIGDGQFLPGFWVGWKRYYALLKAGENMREYPWLANPAAVELHEKALVIAKAALAARVPVASPLVDEEVRLIDFNDEAPTEPHQ